ncbi:hypothetical protein QA645_02620 [Bradyrhizobium sp. CIAT3101]|uniref:hypothetical protein n=1 Tax=Bradyrhizobium sp. CIAT3101 TaxID=439387 RepID=UPI0024B057F7|nr:hypothetical protein [Bradyrhizobium sp. CIAT3101]WFU81660.1 hypothetical protein QA645_02620 [Bradyrhizobium sp. CIAT3101]
MRVTDNNALTRPRSSGARLGKTVLDGSQQRIRRERLAQAARGAGLVQHANGMDARSAARPRNGARQLPTAEKHRRRRKVAQTGGRSMEVRMRRLPSMARFRLMNAPLPLLPG